MSTKVMELQAAREENDIARLKRHNGILKAKLGRRRLKRHHL